MRTQTDRTPTALLALADTHDKQGRLGEAEALYRQLLAAYPGQPELLHRLALVLKARGVFSEAEGLLRRAIAAMPRDPAMHNNLGNVLRNVNRFADAEARYRKAIEIDPAYAEAHYNLGVILEDQTRPDEALEMYRKAVALRPDYPQARTRIGAILRGNGALAEALTELDSVTASDPQSFMGHYYRGLVLADLERFDEGAAALTQATALKPESVEARTALANNLKAASRYDEALTALWSAMELRPLVPETHDEINRLAWMVGRKDLFLSSFTYVRDRFGENPGLLFSEAQIRLQRGDSNGAMPLLRRALALEPDRGDANALIGRMHARRGDYAASYDAFATAVRVAPDVTAFRNEFGYALLLGKEPKQALRQFEEALLVNPVDQLALGGMCLAYRASGDSRYHELVNIESFVRTYPLSLSAGYADAASFNAALGEELLKLHTMTSEPLEQTLRGGTQTAGLLFTRKLKLVEQVREMIAEAVGDYVRTMPDHASHPLLSRKESEFSFTHSWSCKLRSSGFHTNHVHPMGWISSAYYVGLPAALEDPAKRQGWLKFGESHLEMGDDDRAEHFVKPVVGQLVLFPSYFWHGTVPFESNDDRLTIAFDVVPGKVDANAIAPGPY